MDNSVELSVAIDMLDRKIANLNIKLAKKSDKELEQKRNKYLIMRKEIYEGNTLLIDKIINNKEEDND